MPKLDRTGPCGNGPKTGNGWGNCPGKQNNQKSSEVEISRREVGDRNYQGRGRRIYRGQGKRYRNSTLKCFGSVGSTIIIAASLCLALSLAFKHRC